MKQMLWCTLFLIIFTSTFCMQSPRDLPTQETFDDVHFPICPERKQILQTIKAQQLHEEDARKKLINMAIDLDAPCVRSMRQLAGNALHAQDYADACYWSGMGIRFGDPLSALSQATILMSADQLPPFTLPEIESRDEYIHTLLRFAAKSHTLPSRSKKNSNFVLPYAQEYLTNFLSEKHQSYESELESIDVDNLAVLEQDSLGRRHIPVGCFFIKKFIFGDEEKGFSKMPKRGLEWANTLIDSFAFDPHYFRASGACDALHYLSVYNEESEIKERANLLLSRVALHELHAHDAAQKDILKSYLARVSSDNPRALLLQAQIEPDTALESCKKICAHLSKAPQEEQPALILDALAFCNTLLAEKNNDAFSFISDLCHSPEFEHAQELDPSFALNAGLHLSRISSFSLPKIQKKRNKKLLIPR